MNPLTLAVGIARDYLYVVGRYVEALTASQRPDEFTEAGPKRPILLIPGIYEDWRFVRPVAVRLAAAGHPVHFVPELRRNRASIAHGAALAAAVIRSHDLDDVVIIAHSKGGLIGRLLMSEADTGSHVSHMVAINTPFVGNRLARYALGRELREFAPDDALYVRFSTELAANQNITSVFSSFDQVVPDGGTLQGAARNVTVPFVGHFRLLADPRVLSIVGVVADS